MGALTVAVTETVKTEILVNAEVMKKYPFGMLANTIGENIAKINSLESHTYQIQSAIFEGLQKFQQNNTDFLVNVFDNFTLKVTPNGDGCVLALVENTVVLK
jgi:hypothetical protein